MARPVYSTQFVSFPNFSSGPILSVYTVPTGYVALVKQVIIAHGTSIGAGGLYVRSGILETVRAGIYYTGIQDPAVVQIPTRFIVFETEEIYGQSFGGFAADLSVAGDLLTL